MFEAMQLVFYMNSFLEKNKAYIFALIAVVVDFLNEFLSPSSFIFQSTGSTGLAAVVANWFGKQK